MFAYCLWFASIYSGLLFFKKNGGRFFRYLEIIEGKKIRYDLKSCSELLLELQEHLRSGNWIEPDFWQRFLPLSEPFRSIIPKQIQQLREAGIAILPTVDRLRVWNAEQLEILEMANAAVATAKGQALVGGALVPIFGVLFYTFVDEIKPHSLAWIAVLSVAFFAAFSGGVWVLIMANRARFGGLPYALRPALWVIPLTIEWFMSLINTGESVERAWVEARRFALEQIPELQKEWPVGFLSPTQSEKIREKRGRERPKLLVAISELSTQVERAIFLSVMEGSSITERILMVRTQMHTQTVAAIRTELNLLTLRTLKPLFILLFPALLGMIFFGLGFAFYDTLSGEF